MSESPAKLIASLESNLARKDIPDFRVGDTVRVHCKIIEGSKERIQVFEGIVTRRQKGSRPTATFTVRKVSYNIGVERTFLINSPRIDKLELLSRGQVRRSRLYYLRDLRGKASRIDSELVVPETGSAEAVAPAAAPAAQA